MKYVSYFCPVRLFGRVLNMSLVNPKSGGFNLYSNIFARPLYWIIQSFRSLDHSEEGIYFCYVSLRKKISRRQKLSKLTTETLKKCAIFAPQISVLRPNAGKYGPEKLQIQKLFPQFIFQFSWGMQKCTQNLAKDLSRNFLQK